jgi:hypothetical protein
MTRICGATGEQASVSPTVNAGWRRHIGRTDGFVARVTGNFAAMRAAGVRMIASTDAGIPGVRHADLALALPTFAHFAGLSPQEALHCATSQAAEALDIGDVTGTLAPGYAADLVVVDGDPLSDLACLPTPGGDGAGCVGVGADGLTAATDRRPFTEEGRLGESSGQLQRAFAMSRFEFTFDEIMSDNAFEPSS